MPASTSFVKIGLLMTKLGQLDISRSGGGKVGLRHGVYRKLRCFCVGRNRSVEELELEEPHLDMLEYSQKPISGRHELQTYRCDDPLRKADETWRHRPSC